MIARYELHLSLEEWLDLSYRQLDLLHGRCLTLRWQNQWQLGTIAAASYQCGMRNFDPMPTRDDFIFTIVPGQTHTVHKVRRPKRLSNKTRMAAMRMMLRASASRVING